MKRILSACLLSVILLCCVSCGGGDDAIGLVPSYRGPVVTTTDYEFTKDDFLVIASYDDGRDVFVSDYEFEVVGLREGYFIIEFTRGELSNPLYVKCEVPVYPSDVEGAE